MSTRVQTIFDLKKEKSREFRPCDLGDFYLPNSRKEKQILAAILCGDNDRLVLDRSVPIISTAVVAPA